MLYATLGQGWLFLLMLHLGICVALFDEIFRILPAMCKQILLKSNIKKLLKNTNQNAPKISFLPQQKSNNNTKKSIAPAILNNLSVCARVIFAGAICYVGMLFLNYGAVRFYLILAFIVGFWLERIFIAKGVLFLLKKVYNNTKKEQKDETNFKV